MKNRRTIIVAFMLCAVMLLGVGYAAVTNTLDIQGSVTVTDAAAKDEFNLHVYFEGIVVGEFCVQNTAMDESTKDLGLGYTANINANNNDKGHFTISGITKTNDSEDIVFRIQNDSAHEASVKIKTTTNSNDSEFGLTYFFGTEDQKEAIVPADGYVDVTVRVTLIAQPTGQTTANFGMELDVTAGA